MHRGLAGVGDVEPELREPENPRQQRLHDVDRLHPVQPGLALLFDHETGVETDVAVRHLEAGEIPAQHVTKHDQQQHGTAADH